jgi:Kef-type K+ transport system membrane component KefB
MNSMMALLTNPFYEIAFVLLVSAIVGAIGLQLRQPLIVAFIAVGILVGPSAFGWVIPSEEMELLAELGIALLLFVVGLKLDLHLIQSMGSVALATGLGQVAFTSIGGGLISLLLGFAPLTAAYIAVALTFSSTIIVVKLLSDKREIDSLHGRIALGFLIVQDLVVVLVGHLLRALPLLEVPSFQIARRFLRRFP